MPIGSRGMVFILVGTLLSVSSAQAESAASAPVADAVLATAGARDTSRVVALDSAKDSSSAPGAVDTVQGASVHPAYPYIPGVDSSKASEPDTSTLDPSVKAVIDVPRGKDLELQNCRDCDTKSWVLKGIHAHLGELTACYQDFLMKQPKIEGKVSLSFSITAFGLARNVRIASSSTGNAALDLALVARAQGMRFSVPSTEDEVKATVSLKLKSKEK